MAAITLEQKVKDKSAKVGIVGLGYVGLPLAVEFASKGFYVLGIDTDRNKVEKINSGENYIDDIDSEKMRSLVGDGLLEGTTMYGRVGELDIFATPGDQLLELRNDNEIANRVIEPGVLIAGA